MCVCVCVFVCARAYGHSAINNHIHYFPFIIYMENINIFIMIKVVFSVDI